MKRLAEGLDALGEATAIRIIRTSLRDAAKPMISTMVSLAPYKTNDNNNYHIRDNIGMNLEPTRSRSRAAEFRLGARRMVATAGTPEANQGYKFIGALSKGRDAPIYDVIAEKQTPFIRPAFDQTHGRVIILFRRALAKRIARAHRKLERIAAKAAREAMQ